MQNIPFLDKKVCSVKSRLYLVDGEREGREPGGGGGKVAERVREARKEGAGRGIPKVAGSGRNTRKLHNISQLKKRKEPGAD